MIGFNVFRIDQPAAVPPSNDNASASGTASGPRPIPPAPTWRDFISTAPATHWLAVDCEHHARLRPSTDTEIETYEEAAAFLGISVDVLKANEVRLKLPRVIKVLVQGLRVADPWRREWTSAKIANMRKAPFCTTTHMLTVWVSLNDPYSPTAVQRAMPGAGDDAGRNRA